MEQQPFDFDRIRDWKPRRSGNERKFRKLVTALERLSKGTAASIDLIRTKIIKAHSLSRGGLNGEHTRLIEALSARIPHMPMYIGPTDRKELPGVGEARRIMLEIRQERNNKKRALQINGREAGIFDDQAFEEDQRLEDDMIARADALMGDLEKIYPPILTREPDEDDLDADDRMDRVDDLMELLEATYGQASGLSHSDADDEGEETVYLRATEQLLDELDRIAVLRSA